MQKKKIILRGMPVSSGTIKGRVRIINSPTELKEINSGDIIVASFLTPDFVASIKKNSQISGIITDKGGITCHAAIVARELKIPYVAQTGGALKKLKNNITVVLDGKTGLVYQEI